MSLVHESESILTQMKERLRLVAMAEMTRLLLASNGGEGTTIDLKELNELTIRVTLALEIRGIELDREAFMAMVRKDSNISRVLQLVGAIVLGDTISGNHADQHAGEACPDGVSQEDWSLAPAPANKAGPLQLANWQQGRTSRPTPHTTSNDGDAAPMFALQERLTRGSVAAARGRRVSLSQNATLPHESRRHQTLQRTPSVAPGIPIARAEADDESLPSSAAQDPADHVDTSSSSSSAASSASLHLAYS